MKLAALAIAVASFVLAALYFTGHGPMASPGKVHVSHGVLFIVIGLLSLIWFRFQGAPATEPS